MISSHDNERLERHATLWRDLQVQVCVGVCQALLPVSV